MNPEDRLRDALRARAETIEPSTDAWARIRERVDVPTARPLRARGWQLSLAGFAAAGLVVALIAGLLVLRSEDDDGGRRVATPPTTDSIGDEREPLPNFVVAKSDGTVVVVTNADGRERQIADGADHETRLAVTPDGKRVYFDRPGSASSECGPNREIVVVPIEGGEAVVYVENAADPAVSPNGKRLAYVEFPGSSGCLNPTAVVVANLRSRKKVSWRDNENAVVLAPSWAPDSRHLGFAHSRPSDGVTTYRVLDTRDSESLRDAEIVDLGVQPPLGPALAYGYFGHRDAILAFVPEQAGSQLVLVDPNSGEVTRSLFPVTTPDPPRYAVATPRGQNVLYLYGSGLYVWQAVAPTPVAFTDGVAAATFLPAAAER